MKPKNEEKRSAGDIEKLKGGIADIQKTIDSAEKEYAKKKGRPEAGP